MLTTNKLSRPTTEFKTYRTKKTIPYLYVCALFSMFTVVEDHKDLYDCIKHEKCFLFLIIILSYEFMKKIRENFEKEMD